MGIHVCSNEGPRPFPKGDNKEIAKKKNIEKSCSQEITGPISTKLTTKHSWVMKIQVCSNEGSRPFPRGDNKEIMKIH